MNKPSWWVLALATVLLATACARQSQHVSALPLPPLSRLQASESWSAAKQVLEQRCVVCHGCYDAPCQLKLDSYSGIARGATEQRVYDGARLKAVTPTRLDIDAHHPAEWRERGFHAVLPEAGSADARASLLLRMLALKRSAGLPENQDLSRDFTFELERKQTCTDAEHFDDYAKAHPLWGMPYGLPAISDAEWAAVSDWVKDGAPFTEPPTLAQEVTRTIETWESFLNQPSLKNQLMARYLYEHLFLASLYFKDVDDTQFYRLVRSRTQSGAQVDEIATRRPFDDPATQHLYYRFVRRTGPALSKTHMVYPLDAARLQLYRTLFLTPDYVVTELPSYAPEVGANPFRAFAAIPARSRYRFLLTEAAFTIMGFIKGPVCRGQIALNVIQDRFWITFVDPDLSFMADETAFLVSEQPNLDMPAELGSSTLAGLWQSYGKEHDLYMKRRARFLSQRTGNGRQLTMASIWDGDGHNENAALTVFRHFDTATVLQGLVGKPPKTAWVIDYPLLERIHYLLVAGFDVFGNVGHQLSTRVYMDYLRMEGEAGFLSFLPPQRRAKLTASWYRGVSGAGKVRVESDLMGISGPARITYRSATPELELLELLRARVRPILTHQYELAHSEQVLDRLNAISGVGASFFPETAFLTVRNGDKRSSFSILRDSAHTNVAHLFGETARRIKAEDSLSVLPGFVGAYPNALFEVDRKELSDFVDAVGKVDSDVTYHALRQRFGVLRTSPNFWPYSDRIHQESHALTPVTAGLFDYNHLEPF